MTKETVFTGPNNVSVEASAGALHAMLTVVGDAPARCREIADLSTSVATLTWDLPVHEVTINVVQEANATAAAAIFAAIGVCFDAPNALVASQWLTAEDHQTTDSQMFAVAVGVPRTFSFSGDGITRLDTKKLVGVEDVAVYVEAA